MFQKLFFILIFTMLGFSGIFAQTPPKSVTDFYFALPADVYSMDISGNKISGKTALINFRKSLIKIEDVKNGYLKLEGTWEGWAEIALFKKRDGSYIVAQAETGCGPACDGFIKFFTYNNGKWTDITASVFPTPNEVQIKDIFLKKNIDLEENGTTHYYRLPRTGTTVKMACNVCKEGDGEDFVLQEFLWNGEKFTVKR